MTLLEWIFLAVAVAALAVAHLALWKLGCARRKGREA